MYTDIVGNVSLTPILKLKISPFPSPYTFFIKLKKVLRLVNKKSLSLFYLFSKNASNCASSS